MFESNVYIDDINIRNEIKMKIAQGKKLKLATSKNYAAILNTSSYE